MTELLDWCRKSWSALEEEFVFRGWKNRKHKLKINEQRMLIRDLEVLLRCEERDDNGQYRRYRYVVGIDMKKKYGKLSESLVKKIHTQMLRYLNP